MQSAAHFQACIELLTTCLEQSKPADKVLSQYFRQRRYIGAKDKKAIANYYYTVLRQLHRYQYLLSKQELNPSYTLLVALLVLQQDKALISVFTGEKFHPALLSPQTIKTLEAVDFDMLMTAPDFVQFNTPEWLIEKLQVALKERFVIEMLAMDERATLTLRANTLQCSQDEVVKYLQDEDIACQKGKLSPWAILVKENVAWQNDTLFSQGGFEIQDQGSQLIALCTGVEPGQHVVDFCAGAGGKTLAMAAMMKNKGQIFACDTHTYRLKQLTKRAKRANVNNTQSHIIQDEYDALLKRQKNKADVVLVDVPCSGTGTWRRNPDARFHLTPEKLEQLRELQASILHSASRLVKSKGKLVYATCSLLFEENQAQIADFLQKNTNFSYGVLSNIKDIPSEKVLSNTYELQCLPALSECDGFYICVLQKN